MPEFPALVIFGSSFLVGLSGAVAPGPLLAFNIRETVRRGFLAGPYVATGHAILELVVVAGLALRLTQVLDSDPAVAAIGVLGGLFLLWMSWGDGGGTPAGALVSLSNPFWTVWWVTVGATFLTRSLELGLVGIGAFYVGHILSDYFWYGLVSAALTSGRRLMTERVYKGTMLGCGVFLAAMGGYFIVTGVELVR